MKKELAWKRVKDNRMRGHGDIDFDQRLIRVNKSKKKNLRRGEILDSIVHEEFHRVHPKAHEKTVSKKTKKIVQRLSSKTKKKLYSRYR